MFNLPETAPWWAVLGVAVLGIVVFGIPRFVRAMWPQSSVHRKELLREWQRQREQKRAQKYEQERARRRKELGNRE
ncbi:hypothetical protein ACFRKB_15590 [Streptomyces scopuliridis]|uniref:hypothetical protein n=1 Tax=Streptomyces scopuliridis TaxID=452529 RepID=UPI0036A9E783